jgi:hypothetical protein
MEDLTYYREAITLCPPGHLHRSSSLKNLAIAVHTRYLKSVGMDDFEEVNTY